MLLLSMSQAGEPAPRTWSQTSMQTPALQGSREGDQRSHEEVGCGRWELPRLSPRLGRTQPRSQHPTSSFRECPVCLPSHQAVPGVPRVGG